MFSRFFVRILEIFKCAEGVPKMFVGFQNQHPLRKCPCKDSPFASPPVVVVIRIDVEPIIIIVVKHQRTLIALLPYHISLLLHAFKTLLAVAAVFHDNAFRTLAVITRRVVDPFCLLCIGCTT